MFEIREEKNAIRRKYKALRASLTSEHRVALDNEVCRRFTALASFRFAETILFYAPLEQEINIMPAAELALDQGKRIAFPRCNTDDHTMTYHYVTELSQLKVDSYGIREPSQDAPLFDPHKNKKACLCVVPALVYDKQGFRLGYGRGYYDRFLMDFTGTTVGPIYRSFVIDRVPRGRYDANVDVLITEKGVISLNVQRKKI